MLKFIRYLLLLFATAISCVLIYFLLIETPYRPVVIATTTARYKLPQIIAHKAAHPEHPANSMEAIDALLKAGITGIEIDIQQSADNIPIILHGRDLKEDTNGQGLAENKNITELKELVLTHQGSVTSSRIPTLKEILDNYCHRAMLFLDIKAYGIFDQSLIKAVIKEVKQANCEDSVIIDSLNPVVLIQARSLSNKIAVSLSFVEDTTPTMEESPEQLSAIPLFLTWPVTHNFLRALILPDYLGPRATVPLKRIRKLDSLGFPMLAWTVDNPASADELLSNGIQSVMTNQPVELMNVLKNLKVDDASRLNESQVEQIRYIKTEKDIQEALLIAREKKLKVAIAGQRHSMGGQTIAPNGLVIDINAFNKVSYNPTDQTVTVQSGANWKQIQLELDRHQRSVIVMQSDNIFSIGGSLSVNVHGWQPNRGPLADTVNHFRLMKGDGEVINCSKPFQEICQGAIGGYGLFGVILNINLATTANSILQKESAYLPANEMTSAFQAHLKRPDLELLYARLRVDQANFLNEVGVHAFYKKSEQPGSIPLLEEEELIRTKRAIFRLSEQGDAGKLARWFAERDLSKTLEQREVSRNQAMYADFQFIWPGNFSRHDILHEYFIPINQAEKFIESLKTITNQFNQDLLNVTVRHILPDQFSALPYAQEEVLSFVLLVSQQIGDDQEIAMKEYTQALIEAAQTLGGTFYLPYRLHYKQDQLLKSYPMLPDFIRSKKLADPESLFENKLWLYLN